MCVYTLYLYTINAKNVYRIVGVTMLIIRGAFSVNPGAIKKHQKVVLCVAYSSCAIGALVAAVAIHFILGFSLPWSALLG